VFCRYEHKSYLLVFGLNVELTLIMRGHSDHSHGSKGWLRQSSAQRSYLQLVESFLARLLKGRKGKDQN